LLRKKKWRKLVSRYAVWRKFVGNSPYEQKINMVVKSSLIIENSELGRFFDIRANFGTVFAMYKCTGKNFYSEII